MSSTIALIVNGERHEVELLERRSSAVRFKYAGREYTVEYAEDAASRPAATPKQSAAPSAPRRVSSSAAPSTGLVTAALPGIVVDVLVTIGQQVKAGEILLRIEAMKMQNSVFAPIDGFVEAIHVSPGGEIGDGDPLLTIKPANGARS